MVRPGRSTDAARLSFSVQLVILIASTAVTASLSIWGSQYGLRSDLEVMRTRAEAKAEVDAERANVIKAAIEAQAKLAEERSNNIAKTVDEMKRRLELVQLQYQELNNKIATRTSR